MYATFSFIFPHFSLPSLSSRRFFLSRLPTAVPENENKCGISAIRLVVARRRNRDEEEERMRKLVDEKVREEKKGKGTKTGERERERKKEETTE